MQQKNKTLLIASLSIAALLIGTTLFITLSSAHNGWEVAHESAANAFARLATRESDRDSDDLQDWEEELWRTDPDNPDSDGDGTLDGREVSAGRDPTKAGTDAISERTEEGSTEEGPELLSESGSDELTETEKFSQGLISTYLYTKLTAADGAELTDEKLVALAENAFASVEDPKAPNRYSLKDLRVANDSSVSALQAYGNALGVAIFDAPGEKMEYELKIIRDAVENQSPEELLKLKPVIASYRTTADRIRKVAVPAEAAMSHLALVNNMSNTADALEKMAKIFDDPLLSLSWSKLYFLSIEALNVNVGDIVSLFASRGATFPQSSPGYAFTLLYTPPIINSDTNQAGS